MGDVIDMWSEDEQLEFEDVGELIHLLAATVDALGESVSESSAELHESINDGMRVSWVAYNDDCPARSIRLSVERFDATGMIQEH